MEYRPKAAGFKASSLAALSADLKRVRFINAPINLIAIIIITIIIIIQKRKRKSFKKEQK